MNVAILNYPDAVQSSVLGPYDIFGKAGAITEMLGHPNPKADFKVEIVTTAEHKNTNITYHNTIESGKAYDLVIIGAMQVDKVESVLQHEKKMVDWIKWQYKEGAEVSSICLGAFMLAATGLLDGKRATTHWLGVTAFRKMFPKVQLEDDKIIVDQGKIYTSGGAFSFTSLVMYLLEKYCGTETATLASKVFLVNIHQTQQNFYAIFSQQKSHSDERIKEAQDYMEQYYNKKINIAELAAQVGFSNRTFLRRFRAATGNSPIEYLQRLRVETAKKLLEQRPLSIEEISMEVGYEDFSTFRKLFKRFTGSSPSQYRKRYAKIEETVGFAR